MRHIPASEDLIEISVIAWPADEGTGPQLLGRLRDTDLVRQVMDRLIEWHRFSEEYLSGCEEESVPIDAERVDA